MLKFLVHKPIAVLMTSLGVVILGLFASGFVPISLMPDIDIPEITVQVTADNMSARELEDAIIKPLRTHLMQLNHLEEIKSETTAGAANIWLQFAHGTQIDYSFIETNEKIDRAMGGLPLDIERPRVIKASATDIPVFYLNMTLKDAISVRSNGELTQNFVDFSRFINQVVRKRIEQIPEVAMVDSNGLVTTEIVIIPDNQKLIGLGLSLEDIEAAIKEENIEIGSILVKDNQYQYNLRLATTLGSNRDLENIYIQKNERLFQLKDLAQVRVQPKKRKGLVIANDKEAISMAIIKQSDARMNDLKETLNTTIGHMEKEYPEMDFSITRDQTKLLDHAIGNLAQSLLWGMLLAFVVMFFFLKDVKSPLLIGIGVPVSLVVCLLFFHLFHISINIISLSGLVLGTGLMIDNSIIVIDNITQYKDMGYTLSEACVKGANEVFKPLFSSVLTTCAVFVPLIFLSGITGALFYDQAMAISIGLLVSLLVSLTLLPVLYRLFHLKQGRLHRLGRSIEKLNTLNYASLYEKGFRFTMKKQPLAIGAFVVLTGMTIALFMMLPKNQMPELTATETLLAIDWNEPINVEENKKRVLQLMEPVKNRVTDYHAQVGHQQFLLDKRASKKTSESLVYIRAGQEDQLNILKKEIRNNINEQYPNNVATYADVDNIFNLIFSDDAPPLTAKLRNVEHIGSAQNAQLKELWGSIDKQLPHIPLETISWEDHMALVADKEKLMIYDVTPSLLDNSLKSAFNEKEVLSIIDNQDFVPVILGGEEKAIRDILHETMVMANDSTYYNISEFIKETRVQDLKTITAGKEGEYYPVHLHIEQGQEEATTKAIKATIDQNPHYDVLFTGSLFNNRKLIKELSIVLGITLLVLFFILASQFESLTLPMVILLEIPIAMAGAFLLLWVFGMSINLMSMIGIVVMSGIIINDSILKIATIIQLQKQGSSLMKSVLVAGQRRLKPILMTSLTTILALVPILFTSGIGGELQAPLAVALIGGMLIGTLVSLYFVPLCYYHLVKKKSYAI